MENQQKDLQTIPSHFSWEQMLGNGKGKNAANYRLRHLHLGDLDVPRSPYK